MASILPGFEYDIFISYRQKDNKGDRWVSEFVNALRTEIESTFKEDISIYYDENPHDGLLETHDVDASLKEKLKCLVFIPVISRTFCDPKSFAWEHEFKAFVEQASRDQFGLKVTLPSGNVASRILPVRIHDLDINDIKLCESIIGGVLRGVDFIYRSAGVNRPLRVNEDHPQDNLNKTYYRDQINKVANAIDEIFRSLKNVKSGKTDEKNIPNVQNEDLKRVISRGKKGEIFSINKQQKLLLIIFTVLLCFLGATGIYKLVSNNIKDKTIAILFLGNPGNNPALTNVGDVFVGSIENKLNGIRSITVRPKMLTLPFWGTEKPLDAITKDLKINYLLSCRMREEGNKINISVELTAARKKKMLWSKTYLWEKAQVSQITREIVRVIAMDMNIDLSSEEEKYIESDPSNNADANLNFISANLFQKKAWINYSYGSRVHDSVSFKSAIETYDKAIQEDSLFALAYAKRALATSWGFYVRQLDSTFIVKCKMDIDKALSLESDLPDGHIASGFYYYYCIEDFDKALIHFSKAAELDPGNYEPLFYMALVYRRMGNWKESQNLIHRVIRYNPQEALFLTNIGLSYEYLHDYDSALIFHQKAIDMMPGWSSGYGNKIETIILKSGKTSEAKTLVEVAIKKTGKNMVYDRIRLNIYDRKYADALQLAEKSVDADFEEGENRFLYLAAISNLLNNQKNARLYYDSARVNLTIAMNKDPVNYQIHGLAGIAYAGLGNKIKAIEEGEKSTALSQKNKFDECDMRIKFAKILTMTGDYDKAVAEIAFLLNNQSRLSIGLLKLDPVWKPLMDNPEYEAMIMRFSKN